MGCIKERMSCLSVRNTVISYVSCFNHSTEYTDVHRLNSNNLLTIAAVFNVDQIFIPYILDIAAQRHSRKQFKHLVL